MVGRGIGITNIMHRLELLFGQQAKMIINSDLGVGTAILLQTPLLASEPNKGYPQED
jgi:sensor histidine kinase YesM